MHEEEIKSVVDALLKARHVAVLTGSGISAESGIPTFRGADGLWKKFRAEELATPEAFRKRPQLVWEWYAYRRQIISSAGPNPGHFALAEMQRWFPQFTLITQNVDGLHQAAGSEGVLELHGNIFIDRCASCGREESVMGRPIQMSGPPKCSCGGLIRPGVVWFGESLPAGVLEKAMAAARSAEVFFSIGTSALVYPAAALPEMAGESGAMVVEINPETTPLSGRVDVSLRASAASVLPKIVEKYKTVTSA